MPQGVCGSDSDAEDVDRTRRAEPDDVRQTDLRPFDLARTRGAAEVARDLEDARDTRRAERVALREKAARHVDGDAAAVRRFALVDHPSRLAVLAETEVLVVEELGGREAIVELDQVEVVRTDARPLPRLPRGVPRERVHVRERQVALRPRVGRED